MSRFLARHLRHDPAALGVELDRAGWAEVDDVLGGAARLGFPLTREEVEAAVDAPGKRRYELDDTGRRIRARHGHSVPVELGLDPVAPPPVLFHGTHPAALEAILARGLLPMRRRQVHLSEDVEAARQVGARRGAPVVLRVDAAGLARAGATFVHPAPGVWLTDAVPPPFLARLKG